MGEILSPEQAAHRAMCSRRTVVRAIRAGELRATKTNDGRWKIDSDAVDAWAAPVGQPIRQTGQDAQLAQPAQAVAQTLAHAVEVAELRGVVAVVTAERDALQARLAADQEQFRERLVEAQAERDRWRHQAEQLVEAQRQAEQRPSSFWARLEQIVSGRAKPPK